MANDVEIRSAVEADLPRAVTLLGDQLAEHDIASDDAVLERSLRVLLISPELGRVLVAEQDGEVVGAAVLSFMWTIEHGGPAAWLDEVYVLPARRGHGIGRRLVEAAIKVAEARGCVALDLEVESGHQAVERLYERLGFRRHRRTRWVRPLDAPSPPGTRAAADPGPQAVAPDRAISAAQPRAHPALDHLSLGVNDLERSRAFYDAALAPLGLVRHGEIPGEIAYGPAGDDTPPSFPFYIGFEDPAARRDVVPTAGLHVAFLAPSRAAVRAFHAAALAAGGRDNGAPGLRPQYHAHYYGAFVLDPDGHHVEAVCHAPEP